MEEQWRPITCLKHFDQMCGRYEASNLGHIRNARTGKMRVPSVHNSTYYQFVYRYRDDEGKVRQTSMLWHRVIAMTWIENPNNLPQIDHINRDKYDNRVENLRWVSAQENQANTVRTGKAKHSRYNPTKVVDRNGNVIAEYPNLIEACKDYHLTIHYALDMMNGYRRPKSWGTFTQDKFDD